MRFFKRRSTNTNGGAPPEKLGFWGTILLLLYPVLRPAQWLWDRVYGHHGLGGWLLILAGLASAGYVGGIQVGQHLLQEYFQFGTAGWLSGALGAWLVFFLYGFPALWVFIVNPAWELGDAIHDRMRDWARDNAANLFGGVLKCITWLPGSSAAWKAVIDKEEKPLIVKALGAAFFLSLLALSGYAAWLCFGLTFTLVTHYLTFAGLGQPVGWTLGVGVGVFVLWVIGGSLTQLLHYGKHNFCAVLLGLVAGWFGFDLATSFGFGWLAAGGITLGSVLLLVGYLFPLLVLAFSNGFWGEVLKAIRPLNKAAYGVRDESKTYSYFISHVLALLAAGLFVWGAYTFCAALGLGTYLTVLVCALTAWCGYGLSFKATDHDGGLVMYGIAAGLSAAITSGNLYLHAGLWGGVWMAIPIAVVVLLLTSGVIVPLILRGVQKLTFGIGKLGLEGPASTAFNRANDKYLKAQTKMRNLARDVYDKTEDKAYRNQFLHISNLIATFAVWSVTPAVTGMLGFSPLWAFITLCAAPAVSYLFAGRIMTESNHGVSSVASTLGLIAAIFVGSIVYNMGSGLAVLILSCVAGIFAAAALIGMLFPPIFQTVRFLTEAWTVKWLGPLIGWVHEKLWAPVGWFGEMLEAAWEATVEWMRPRMEWLFAMFAKVQATWTKVLDRIRGRK